MTLSDKQKEILEKFDKRWNFNGDFQNKPVFNDIKSFILHSLSEIAEATKEAMIDEIPRIAENHYKFRGKQRTLSRPDLYSICEDLNKHFQEFIK